MVSFSFPSKRGEPRWPLVSTIFGERKVTDLFFPSFHRREQIIQSDDEGKSKERLDGGDELCDGNYDDPRDEGSKKSAYIRVDTGVAPGYVVSPHYDPILSASIMSFLHTL